MADAIPLFLGCPVRFQERWSGRLAGLEVTEDWEVLNVTIERGLVRKSNVRLPLSAATSWSAEYLAFDGTSSEAAFAREVPPVAAPARPISAETPVAMTGVRLAGVIIES